MANDSRKQEHMIPALREAAQALIQLKTREWQLELAWGQSLRERVIARLKGQEEETLLNSPSVEA